MPEATRTDAAEAQPAAQRTARLAHGQVSSIRAMPSRQLSVIAIELPAEFHVEATNLLYGRDVLLHCTRLPAQTPYGVLDEERLSDEGGEEGQARDDGADGGALAGGGEATPTSTPAYFLGYVALVKAIPSRQVTSITIELPEQCHVAATCALYGRDALVLPTTLRKRFAYGILPPIDAAEDGRARAPQATNAANAVAQRPAAREARTAREGALGGGRATRRQPTDNDPVRWLGARCTESAFQEWLGVRSEAAAIAEVRRRCGVGSRRDIPASAQSLALFHSEIKTPFLRRFARAGTATSSATPATPASRAPRRFANGDDPFAALTARARARGAD